MNLEAVPRIYKGRVASGLAAVALLFAAPAAFAHTHPLSMTPAADSTVSSPAKIAIRFSEAIEPKFSSITVTDAAGHVVTKEPAVCAADKLNMTLALPALAPGVYTVNWVAVSVDTHRSQGNYKFTVK
jgi:methionine-rich copper-binding protein CopC